jgi:hypothetical protein
MEPAVHLSFERESDGVASLFGGNQLGGLE